MRSKERRDLALFYFEIFFNMAKELPYFKFEPNQWENGNIQICSREDKGLFMDLCSMYWSRLGDVPLKLAIMKLCGGDNNKLNHLASNDIFSIDDGMITISFLDDQLEGFNIKSKVNSDNAYNRWDKIPERIRGNIVYVIRCWDEIEEFLKIGITSRSINRRFSGKIPYNFEAVVVDHYDSIDLESQYTNIAIGHEYTANKKFSGYNECYDMAALDDIIAFSNIRNAKYVRNTCESDAIREEKRRGDKIREEEKKIEESNFLFLKDSEEKVFDLYQFLNEKYKMQVENWCKLYPNVGLKKVCEVFELKNMGKEYADKNNLRNAVNLEWGRLDKENSFSTGSKTTKVVAMNR